MTNDRPKSLQGMEVRQELVILDLEAKTNAEALEKLAQRLLDNDLVKPSFIPAILKREEDYCTGLTFPEMGIAIPHTDAEHVKKPCVGIASLQKPVTFQSMGMLNVPCEVEMLFMLGITDPESQLKFLTTLMVTFQTSGRLWALKACETPEKLTELFKSYFE